MPSHPRPPTAAGFSARRIDATTGVVLPHGALDLASAPLLKRTLGELARGGCTRIVVDLSEVTFMDSTALGVLIGIKRRLGANGVLAIAAAHPQALKLFELTGLDRTIQLFPTLEAAIRSLPGTAEEDPGSRESVGTPLPLSGDAGIVVGIASTAIPFADSRQDEVERWLRALLVHGEAGLALASCGYTDAPPNAEADEQGTNPSRSGEGIDEDVVAAVTERAHQIATGRGASTIRTTDLLAAVIDHYGDDCEQVLARRGTTSGELLDLVH